MSAVEWLVLIGVLGNVIGTSFYIAHTLRGRTKPNRMTFLLWGTAPFIAAAASVSQGVTWAAIPVVVSALCPLAVFAASFVNPHARWQLSTFDYVCGALSVLALILWWITDVPNVAIVFAILSDTLAGYPTLVKAWKHPETESWQGYAAAVFSAGTSFFVATAVDFASLAFPTYLVVMNILIVFGIWRGRARRRVI